MDLEPNHHLVALGRHLWASAPRAASRAYATRNIMYSSKCAQMIWPPTGRCRTRPIGIDIAGTPARFAVTVKMSLRYISYGSLIAPMWNAGVGVVGVKIALTPLENTALKSSAIRLRTACAFR